MTPLEWGSMAASTSVVIGFVWRVVNKMRKNDLVHLDMKLDNVVEMLKTNQATTDRVEGKIDHHLEWHSTK